MEYFGGAYESRDMSLETMTEGISVQGMRDFTELLKAELLTGVTEKLSETEGMVNAIKAGWQGQARDHFLQSFEKGINTVKNDLEAEYRDVLMKLGQLMDNYYEQDQKMMNIID